MPNITRRVLPAMAGLAVLAVPLAAQTVVQAQHLPVIRYGSEGPAVKTAERSLQQLGYYHGAIDGIFGPEMLAAVKSFQGHYGLAQNGVVGSGTWAQLSATLGTPATTSNTANLPYDVAPVLQLGSTGPAVVHLQQLLNQHNAHLATDGDFGPLTYAAVRTFQASRGLPVTGIANAATLNALTSTQTSNSVSDPVEAAPAYPSGYLHEWDTGSAVVTLQKDLTQLGYSTKGIDGIFGPDTLAAVQAFQRAQHLPSYGLVGSLTWNALNTALSAGATTNGANAPAGSLQNSVNRGSVSATASAIVGLALKYQGAAYVWGGNSPAVGFDCSGYVQWIYGQYGINLPRTSFAQWNVGQHVTYDELQPGDLVFFTIDGVFANHVGIYIGNGEFISAATPSQGVVVQSLSDPFFAQSFDGGVSLIPQ